jgi:hypothetical protein
MLIILLITHVTMHEKECNEIFVKLRNYIAKFVGLPPPPLISKYLQDKVPTNMEKTHCNFALLNQTPERRHGSTRVLAPSFHV